MRNVMKALAIGFAAVVAFVSPLPHTSATAAQFIVLDKSEDGVSGAIAAIDTDNVGFIVRYVGTTPTATTNLSVEAIGDLTFVKNGAADTNVACPVADADGTIDVSDAACNTFGEICDAINITAEWRCLPVASLRTDTIDTDSLVAAATTRAVTTPDGYGVLIDNTAEDFLSLYLYSKAGGPDAPDFGIAAAGGAGSGSSSTTNRVRPAQPRSPYFGRLSALARFTSTVTHGGAGTITISGVTRVFNPNIGSVPGAAAVTYSETVRTVYGPVAGAATTVAQTLDFTNTPLRFNQGEEILIRRADTAQTAMTASADGVSWSR